MTAPLSKETKLDPQPPARKVTPMWGVYQWGRLWYVEHTKHDAIKAAIRASGEPWRKTKTYFRVQRVEVKAL